MSAQSHVDRKLHKLVKKYGSIKKIPRDITDKMFIEILETMKESQTAKRIKLANKDIDYSKIPKIKFTEQ